MSLNTIGLIKEIIPHSQIIEVLESEYKEIYTINTLDDGSGLDHTRVSFYDGTEVREITILESKGPLESDDPDEIDSKELGTYLSLNAFGNAEEIMITLLRYFGGYIDTNDCDGIELHKTFIYKTK